MKRIAKILGKIVLGIFVILLLLFAFAYMKYNEPLPKGTESAEADAMATKMLTALKYDDYKKTRYVSWTFKRGNHHYKWDKDQYRVEVTWSNVVVNLNLKAPQTSTVKIDGNEITSTEKTDYIKKAQTYFNNDSFWIVAPYKVFDEGVTRSIATNEAGEKGLLITYNAGGTTPGDSYLWFLDENGRPKGYQMWVKIIPIGGLYASWEDWQTLESGIALPRTHNLLFLNVAIDDLKAWN